MIKYEALQLSLWYIELALLSILNYDDRYQNRCGSFSDLNEREPFVPWRIIPSVNKNEF